MSEGPPARPLTLLVPGPWTDAAQAPRLDARWSIEWVARDGDVVEAFRHGRLDADELAAIEGCGGALVVEGTLALPAEQAALVALARALVDAGARGVRVEQSKAAWPAARWLALVEEGQWFSACVVTLQDDRELETCGMHLFGRPDVRVATADPAEGAATARSLCEYQLDEDPLLLSGHTFRPDDDTPRRVLDRWPDDRYPARHPCHNPFGVLRLEAAGPTAPTEPALLCIPALLVILVAAEREAGRPLTRAEVEAIRDGAACVAGTHTQARALEQARGYADLDLERAWEQWQVARVALVDD